MWTIIKVDLKNLEFLKNEFKKSRRGCKIYSPKLFIEKYKKNKLIGKELNLSEIIYFVIILNSKIMKL